MKWIRNTSLRTKLIVSFVAINILLISMWFSVKKKDRSNLINPYSVK